MKIGLVTWFHKGYNYGSSLQAFALQEALKNKSFDVELINYSPMKKNLV